MHYAPGGKYIDVNDYDSIVEAGWDIRELKLKQHSLDPKVFVMTKMIYGEKRIFMYQKIKSDKSKLVYLPDSYKIFKELFSTYKGSTSLTVA